MLDVVVIIIEEHQPILFGCTYSNDSDDPYSAFNNVMLLFRNDIKLVFSLQSFPL